MSDQSDAPVSTEPSDHVVTIPPEQPDHIVRFYMDFDRWDRIRRSFYPLESLANQSEHDEDEDTPASPGLRFSRSFWDTSMHSHLLESQANQRDPFCMNFHLLESRANQRDAFGLNVDLRASQANQREDEDDLWNLSDELIEEMHALLNQHETREVGYDGQFRHGSTFGLNPGSSFFNPGLQASQANQREHILMNSLANSFSFRQALQRAHQARSEPDEDEDTLLLPGFRFFRRFRDHDEDGATLVSQSSRLFGRLRDTYGLDVDLRASPASQRSTFGLNPGSSFFNPGLQASQANQREHILMNSSANTFSFRQALQRAHQARRSVELMIGQVWMLESCVRFFEDFDSLALPRQQTREVWYDGWNGYGRPGDRYTVIGLISTISCAIYSIMFGLTGQMYKEEDGSFFSHHRVMVTISMLSMVYAAFSGVFLCVIYYLATTDPTHTYRRRMRFLSGTFVSAACFGPAVMFMAMFVGPLGFKVFAWAVLGAALTRVGFYIGG